MSARERDEHDELIAAATSVVAQATAPSSFQLLSLLPQPLLALVAPALDVGLLLLL